MSLQQQSWLRASQGLLFKGAFSKMILVKNIDFFLTYPQSQTYKYQFLSGPSPQSKVRKRGEQAMYAVIKTGGKQYKVSAGDLLKIEKLEGAVGDTIELDEVLMVGGEEVKIGTPLLPNAKVTAVIVEQGKDKKILVFKSKRRKNYRKKYGHRQPLTRLKIMNIEA
jgi:large subunit ribosomal protein L21